MPDLETVDTWQGRRLLDRDGGRYDTTQRERGRRGR
jgi:hypothetical protein